MIFFLMSYIIVTHFNEIKFVAIKEQYMIEFWLKSCEWSLSEIEAKNPNFLRLQSSNSSLLIGRAMLGKIDLAFN